MTLVGRPNTCVTSFPANSLISDRQGKRLLEQHSSSASRTPLLEVEQGCEPALFLALFSYMLPPLAAVVLQGRDEAPDLRQARFIMSRRWISHRSCTGWHKSPGPRQGGFLSTPPLRFPDGPCRW